MGQAFDRDGNVLGEMYGQTKSEVFDKLNLAFREAQEIRVRSLDADAGQIEMPRYQCHKKVHALKIAALRMNGEGDERDGSATIVPAEHGYAAFSVSRDWMSKHAPEVGGYYVVYDDGYTSFSPSKAFEDGYTQNLGRSGPRRTGRMGKPEYDTTLARIAGNIVGPLFLNESTRGAAVETAVKLARRIVQEIKETESAPEAKYGGYGYSGSGAEGPTPKETSGGGST